MVRPRSLIRLISILGLVLCAVAIPQQVRAATCFGKTATITTSFTLTEV